MSTQSVEALKPSIAEMTARSIERIQRIAIEFPGKAYVMTSAGVHSALILDLIAESGEKPSVIHLDTGFRPPETAQHLSYLEDLYGFNANIYSPSRLQQWIIKRRQMWNTDPSKYSDLTKHRPLARAADELGIGVLYTAIRRSQTRDRAEIGPTRVDNNGMHYAHPVFDWTDEHVDKYFETRLIPYHPLYPEYGSVDDIHFMKPGPGRSGRIRNDCGLHTKDGAPVFIDEAAG